MARDPGPGFRLVIYDLTRLIRRRKAAAPTGIDRVDIAYARWFSGQRDRFETIFVDQVEGGLCLVSTTMAERLIDELYRRWAGQSHRRANGKDDLEDYFSRPQKLSGYLDAALEGKLRGSFPSLFVNTTHHGTSNGELYTHLQTKFRIQFCFYIHDIIPIEFPEYVRAGDDQSHAHRLRSMLATDPIILVNSAATRDALDRWMIGNGYPISGARIATIGVEPQFQRAAPLPEVNDEPYFVVLGTIEPRKNHLLLFNVWRRMAEVGQGPVPRLYVVGKRGWENEGIVAMLDRCPSLKNHVTELSATSDSELQSLMLGARGLLFPSFGEGWGMPLVESLALGVPAICSDLPVFREAGQNHPDYVDPLDGPAWLAMIRAYSDPASEKRRTQIRRLKGYRVPTWEAHFEVVRSALDERGRRSRGKAGQQIAWIPELAGATITVFEGSASVATPGDVRSCVREADANRDVHECEKAARLYLAAVRLAPDRGDLWVQLGHMLKESGHMAGAFEAYATALRLMPGDGDLHLQFGHLMSLSGRREDANFYYRKASELDPRVSSHRFIR